MSKRIFLDTNLLLDVVEDILQAVCAQDGRCETILTHTPKHFQIGPGLLPGWVSPQVLTPEQFMLI